MFWERKLWTWSRFFIHKQVIIRVFSTRSGKEEKIIHVLMKLPASLSEALWVKHCRGFNEVQYTGMNLYKNWTNTKAAKYMCVCVRPYLLAHINLIQVQGSLLLHLLTAPASGCSEARLLHLWTVHFRLPIWRSETKSITVIGTFQTSFSRWFMTKYAGAPTSRVCDRFCIKSTNMLK